MATLAGGKYLGRSVDVDAMADRAVTEPGFFVWVTNASASHPVLLWRMHALRDRRRPGRLLWRPKEPWLWGAPAVPGAYALPAMVGFIPTTLPQAAPERTVTQAVPVGAVSNDATPVRRESEGDGATAPYPDATAPAAVPLPSREDERWRP